MAVFEIADYCLYEPVVLVKAVVLALTVVGPEVDPARVIENVVATATVLHPQVLNHLVAKVADWY